MEGWLFKKSSGLLSSWQKRYFHLSNYTLAYKEKPDSRELKDSIDLRQVKTVVSNQGQGELEFLITTAAKLYQLKAGSKEEKTIWLNLVSGFHGFADRLETFIPIPECYFHSAITLIDAITARGIAVEGIFRLQGSNDNISKLFRLALLDQLHASTVATAEIHELAGLLKRILRELPETPFTNQQFDQFLSSPPPAPEVIYQLIQALPAENCLLVTKLFEMCAAIVANESKTKMDAKNLTIVMGPNLGRKDESHVLVPIGPLITVVVNNKNISLYGNPDGPIKRRQSRSNSVNRSPSEGTRNLNPPAMPPRPAGSSSPVAQSHSLSHSPGLQSRNSQSSTPRRAAPAMPINPPALSLDSHNSLNPTSNATVNQNQTQPQTHSSASSRRTSVSKSIEENSNLIPAPTPYGVAPILSSPSAPSLSRSASIKSAAVNNSSSINKTPTNGPTPAPAQPNSIQAQLMAAQLQFQRENSVSSQSSNLSLSGNSRQPHTGPVRATSSSAAQANANTAGAGEHRNDGARSIDELTDLSQLSEYVERKEASKPTKTNEIKDAGKSVKLNVNPHPANQKSSPKSDFDDFDESDLFGASMENPGELDLGDDLMDEEVKPSKSNQFIIAKKLAEEKQKAKAANEGNDKENKKIPNQTQSQVSVPLQHQNSNSNKRVDEDESWDVTDDTSELLTQMKTKSNIKETTNKPQPQQSQPQLQPQPQSANNSLDSSTLVDSIRPSKKKSLFDDVEAPKIPNEKSLLKTTAEEGKKSNKTANESNNETSIELDFSQQQTAALQLNSTLDDSIRPAKPAANQLKKSESNEEIKSNESKSETKKANQAKQAESAKPQTSRSAAVSVPFVPKKPNSADDESEIDLRSNISVDLTFGDDSEFDFSEMGNANTNTHANANANANTNTSSREVKKSTKPPIQPAAQKKPTGGDGKKTQSSSESSEPTHAQSQSPLVADSLMKRGAPLSTVKESGLTPATEARSKGGDESSESKNSNAEVARRLDSQLNSASQSQSQSQRSSAVTSRNVSQQKPLSEFGNENESTMGGNNGTGTAAGSELDESDNLSIGEPQPQNNRKPVTKPEPQQQNARTQSAPAAKQNPTPANPQANSNSNQTNNNTQAPQQTQNANPNPAVTASSSAKPQPAAAARAARPQSQSPQKAQSSVFRVNPPLLSAAANARVDESVNLSDLPSLQFADDTFEIDVTLDEKKQENNRKQKLAKSNPQNNIGQNQSQNANYNPTNSAASSSISPDSHSSQSPNRRFVPSHPQAPTQPRFSFDPTSNPILESASPKELSRLHSRIAELEADKDSERRLTQQKFREFRDQHEAQKEEIRSIVKQLKNAEFVDAEQKEKLKDAWAEIEKIKAINEEEQTEAKNEAKKLQLIAQEAAGKIKELTSQLHREQLNSQKSTRVVEEMKAQLALALGEKESDLDRIKALEKETSEFRQLLAQEKSRLDPVQRRIEEKAERQKERQIAAAVESQLRSEKREAAEAAEAARNQNHRLEQEIMRLEGQLMTVSRSLQQAEAESRERRLELDYLKAEFQNARSQQESEKERIKAELNEFKQIHIADTEELAAVKYQLQQTKLKFDKIQSVKMQTDKEIEEQKENTNTQNNNNLRQQMPQPHYSTAVEYSRAAFPAVWNSADLTNAANSIPFLSSEAVGSTSLFDRLAKRLAAADRNNFESKEQTNSNASAAVDSADSLFPALFRDSKQKLRSIELISQWSLHESQQRLQALELEFPQFKQNERNYYQTNNKI